MDRNRSCAGCGWDGTGPHCHLCHEPVASLDHLRLLHPDVYGDGPARWPDAGLVVVDRTLEAGDFDGP